MLSSLITKDHKFKLHFSMIKLINMIKSYCKTKFTYSLMEVSKWLIKNTLQSKTIIQLFLIEILKSKKLKMICKFKNKDFVLRPLIRFITLNQ